MNKVDSRVLASWLDDTLQAARFKDYCPNGMQVEGRSEVGHIITGVTASEALLRAAVERGADAVLVHHGWMWRNEDRRVIGTRRTRMALTLKNDLNLYAYHLPLDAHPTLGNNAQLARVLGLSPARRDDGAPLTCGQDGLIWLGEASGLTTLGQLGERVAQRLGRPPLVVGDPDQPLATIAWCTGGAQGMMGDAVDAGASVYITGEVSESTVHLARETGVGFIAAGHHATERYGVQALGQAVAERFGVKVEFVDIDNPA
ncbi:Nif3-like dinuclear metal center hexameric protein [Achromobacter mucicolens]|uniref:Nif3-like dinuclear metal center hexameric protein n=1 Tax=Achromobacter mucicolens TaxID=1389922 RepID=A0ABD4YQ61_9BURK|nr:MULTISPECIES: Nif3-like dinuclear metal center hexameric protein [Achromobacter]MCP2514515.1 Nif3-like dinuclear metal center hexameric protein [Achromobacter mucicolens]MDH1177587.1 Nif3-like dinuclear metal center hexameric protein [Achromobacter mucicolens]WGJ90865.1 Nif3-like dinuclear metal center hexameric protein [Achromobacter mucicolens]CAB3866953.1 GTP cyclohydrolase 1 type 2 [Achromobacter mucicolens]